MTSYDLKYSKMSQGCKRYQDSIERLKNLVYGYNISLDYVIPYVAPFNLSFSSQESIGVPAFIDSIIDIRKNLTVETADCFDAPPSDEEIQHIYDMLICTLFFLQSECNEDDYTFLGLIKIMKTFLGEISTQEVSNKRHSTFWIMYDDISSDKKKCHPEIVQAAFERLYYNFNYNELSRIADKIWYCIRFFLYDDRIDFISDHLMLLMTLDMISETEKRLLNIYENRKPRS